MAAWLPALKAILPYVSQVVSVALPVFTKMADKNKVQDVVPNQIQELQTAATHNAESLKVLADQLQKTITSIESGAVKMESELRALKRLSVAAILLSLAAVAASIVSWLH
ncbi:MAG: hypothetical protein ABI648_04280 [Betaproteobacteria bacterium]